MERHAKEPVVERRSRRQTASVPPALGRAGELGNRSLKALLGPGAMGGRPLDSSVRAQLEARLGTDLSHVRVHTGPAAAASADALSARAYTVGRDVVFGPGE